MRAGKLTESQRIRNQKQKEIINRTKNWNRYEKKRSGWYLSTNVRQTDGQLVTLAVDVSGQKACEYMIATVETAEGRATVMWEMTR